MTPQAAAIVLQLILHALTGCQEEAQPGTPHGTSAWLSTGPHVLATDMAWHGTSWRLMIVIQWLTNGFQWSTDMAVNHSDSMDFNG